VTTRNWSRPCCPRTPQPSAGTGRISEQPDVLELRPGHDEDATRDQVAAVVPSDVGVRPVAVHAVAPGSIPKTPSGKLQHIEAARLWGADQ
jgi:fatty-acyl-CoA synthase